MRRSIVLVLVLLIAVGIGMAAASLIGGIVSDNVLAATVCGDGIITDGEQCEDGNTNNGDGCNSSCLRECTVPSDCNPFAGPVGICHQADIQTVMKGPGECVSGTCQATPQPCTTELGKCNDGLDNDLDGPKDCADSDCAADSYCGGTETICDDALDNDLDGQKNCADSDCNGKTCGVGKTCQGGDCLPSGVTCPNGVIDGGEGCDDNNSANGDGCNSACQVESGWTCSGAPSVCQKCGNGVKEGTEQCDDGGTTSGDGCSATCQNEAPCNNNGACDSGAGETCVNCMQDCSCGGIEQCDDGNTADNDGCSSTCQSENLCVGGGPNGVKTGDEECDDGNGSNTDTCDNNCRLTVCGDGITQPLGRDGAVGGGDDEQCDDGNTLAGDTCSPTCQNVTANECGNGIIEGTEVCDDGKRCTVTGDPCSADADCAGGGNVCRGFSADGCTTPFGCMPTQTPEATCNDSLDNDCDGLTDCADSDCAGSYACASVTVSCCVNAIPGTLTMTMNGHTGCSCANGTNVKMTWNPSAAGGGGGWVYQGTICGKNWDVVLYCPGGSSSAGDFQIGSFGGDSCVGPTGPNTVGAQCNPLSLPFTGDGNGIGVSCCADNVDITIGE